LGTDPPTFATEHPIFAYWLDETLKIGALAIGAAWTFWNYKKSRIYAPTPDIEVEGDIFFESSDLFIDITATLKNLGAGKHVVQSAGTYCELFAVHKDLSEKAIRLFEVFTLDDRAEPGESISDHLVWRIENPPMDVIWLRIKLRAVSGKIEWNKTTMVRIPRAPSQQLSSLREVDHAIQEQQRGSN